MWLPGAKVAEEHQQHHENDCWQVDLQSCAPILTGLRNVDTFSTLWRHVRMSICDFLWPPYEPAKGSRGTGLGRSPPRGQVRIGGLHTPLRT
ncbi:jg11933 [Pararge aegeria aegeria]|uniref:Jg11933 protein n=1 Tax=Pararge aegeria aegeria TaxID=348720 RepID=A0A8S4S8X0_9NEOP|nr:jg11933 [Pararge aegeria aegeria]